MRHHLFIKYQRWTPEIRRLWWEVEADCEGDPQGPSVCLLFRDARATPALLEFLGDTRVGRMLGQTPLAGGLVEGESELEEIKMWPQAAEEEAGDSEESEEEDGPGPPI